MIGTTTKDKFVRHDFKDLIGPVRSNFSYFLSPNEWRLLPAGYFQSSSTAWLAVFAYRMMPFLIQP